MEEELYAGACLDLVLASFLWARYPRYARGVVEAVAEVLAWLGPVTKGPPGSVAGAALA
jgi:hypothetical protein